MKIHTRTVIETISMKQLFKNLNIKNEEHSQYLPKFNLWVEGPSGYNKIQNLFRTEKQTVNTLYFSNGRTLQCSEKHKIKCNGEWKYAKDIIPKNDIIETKTGITFLIKRIVKNDPKILYDISVEQTHCYYSNNILSHNSWTLASIGLHALKMGKNVLHFTLELNENYTGMRYDSKLMGIASQNLKYHIDDLKMKIMSDIKGKLRIKYYPTKSIGVSGLKTHISRLKSIGYNPDLIIVDYADILRSDSIAAQKGGSYYEAGGIYEDLRGLAGEFQVPVWTASQANRSASENDIITGENVAESYKKIMTGDVIISMSRKIEDKLANTARCHIIKNRYGIDGITLPAKVDTSVGKIDIFSPESINGMSVNKEMKNSNEVLKKTLSQKYKEFQSETSPSVGNDFE